MARKFKVSAIIEAQDQASRTLDKVESRFGRLGKALRVGLVGAATAAVGSLAGLTAAIAKSIKAAQTQEDAVNQLNAALASLGPAAEGVSKRLQEQAAALQQVTKFGDEAIIQGQALIASFTRNEEQIKQATKAALDLAAATGQDLKSAFLLLGRAAAGETGTLSRYGIIIEDGLDKSERFAAAIEAIGRQFGGQAQAQAKTFSGAMAQLSNAFGDLLERLGFAITENEKVVASIRRMTKALTSDGAIAAIEALGSVAAKAAEAASKLAETTVETASKTSDLIRGLGEARRILAAQLDELKRAELGMAAFGASSEVTAEQLRDAEERVRRFAEALGLSTLGKEINRSIREGSKLGQTLTELGRKARIAEENAKALTDVYRSFTDVNFALRDSLEAAGDGATAAAAALDDAKESASAAATQFEALDEAARVLGQTTSVQLENRILQMTLALEAQKAVLGENSAEFQRLREVTERTIENLRLRIRNLREGLGDLQEGTSAASSGIREIGQASEESARSVERLSRTVRQTSRELAASASQIADPFESARESRNRGRSQLFPELANVRFLGRANETTLQRLRQGRL